MPWCPLDKEYEVGEISLIPFDRAATNDQYDSTELSQVLSILSSYRDFEGRPNPELTLVKYQGRPMFSELPSEEYEIARELVELACFSAISRRTYFSFGDYCNATNFILYGQRFTVGSNHVVIVSRRGDGATNSMRAIGNTVFSMPSQAKPLGKVNLDEQLLDSVVAFREGADSKEWSRWQNSIACFNLANTDADNITHQVEWTLLCSAFERLLAADSKAIDVAMRFSAVFAPTNPIPISDATRKPSRCSDKTKPLSLEWMREFYSVRGDFAHGKLNTGQPLAWHPLEHLSLARIAFPLLLKCLLSIAGKYTVTEHDLAEIDAFECLANAAFLTEPPDSQGSMDSWWQRCQSQAKRQITIKAAVKYWNEHR